MPVPKTIAETTPRSWLFVPGDSERKLAKGAAAGADVLILDLEDSVSAPHKAAARRRVADFLQRDRSSAGLWVRINALSNPESSKDLECVLPAEPDGIVVPKPRGVHDIIELGAQLDELERRFDKVQGSTKILPIATETAESVFGLGDYQRAGPRLAALTWGAEDLSVALGAATNVDADGEWLPPYQLVRSLCLLGAAAAGVAAIDTVCTQLRDTERLIGQTSAAQRDGFCGKLAVHPDQVGVINRIFQPSSEAVAQARRVIEAFENAAGSAAISLDGAMLDRPHLSRARRILALAARIESRG